MKQVGIFFGSDTGNTEMVAEIMQKMLGKEIADIFDVRKSSLRDLESYPNIIFGASTQGIGDMQGDFDDFLDIIKDADLSGKTIAIYGLGDQDTYEDTFCDAIGTIYDTLGNKNCNIVGFVSKESYEFSDSTAYRDNLFVGLPLDEDNQSDLTQQRVENWINNLKKEFKL